MISAVTVTSTLSGPLPKVGVIVLAALVGVALLAQAPRPRAAAVLAALGLAPTLLIIDIWHSPQLSVVHRHPALAAAAAALALALVAGLAVVILRRPWAFALLVILTLPFRVPIQAGGTTSNLLVPLYVVVGAGAVAFVVAVLRDQLPPRPDTHDRLVVWLERLLALYVALYAVQSVYSNDFEKALQQMVFFYVPFGLMFVLLRQLRWGDRLLRGSLELVAVLAILFAIVGFVEYATKTIILNPKLVVQNDLHTYFTVNSVFFDPDIFGRFLALVMITLAGVLLYARRRTDQLALTVVLGVLWAGLVLTLSRSSLGALLLGLAVLAALRWRPSRTLVAGVAIIVIGAVVVAATPKTFGLNQGLNGASSGRAGLISGGMHMFGERPVWGFGSGSFPAQYRAEHPATDQTLAASHTIAVTIAAEQGLIGLIVYIALVLVAMVALIRNARGDPARTAIAAAFIALVLHTNLYADFLEDPVTWTLLGVGAALALARREAPAVEIEHQPEPVSALA
jgi:putative inorganic carbon (hco3(-)) transporter